MTARDRAGEGLANAVRQSMHACGCKRMVPPFPTGCPPCDLLTAALAVYEQAIADQAPSPDDGLTRAMDGVPFAVAGWDDSTVAPCCDGHRHPCDLPTAETRVDSDGSLHLRIPGDHRGDWTEIGIQRCPFHPDAVAPSPDAQAVEAQLVARRVASGFSSGGEVTFRLRETFTMEPGDVLELRRIPAAIAGAPGKEPVK